MTGGGGLQENEKFAVLLEIPGPMTKEKRAELQKEFTKIVKQFHAKVQFRMKGFKQAENA